MNFKSLCLIILLGVFPVLIHAEEMSLQDQITEIKDKIKEQEELQQKLRDDLAARDEEVTKLKQQLQELEEQIGG